MTCPRCKKKVSFKEAMDILAYCEVQFDAGFDAMDAQEPEKAIKVLSEAIDLFHR